MERAMTVTTLPALVLGGGVGRNQGAASTGWAKAVALPTLQGPEIGRTLLYRPGDVVALAVDTAIGLL
jgi:hypothetical protein